MISAVSYAVRARNNIHPRFRGGSWRLHKSTTCCSASPKQTPFILYFRANVRINNNKFSSPRQKTFRSLLEEQFLRRKYFRGTLFAMRGQPLQRSE